MENNSDTKIRKAPSPLGRAGVGLKVCGNKFNTKEVAALRPDYLGFIFWEPSKRYHDAPTLPLIPENIKKVGVFVDSEQEEIVQKVRGFELSMIQLHGNEPAHFCATLKAELKNIELIKVFSVDDDFDFDRILAYEEVCDYYLFDTKGKLPGGNGYGFDWGLLSDYPSDKPYFLSGGIGPDEVQSLKEFMGLPVSRYCHAIDVNSKFEIRPGLKDIEKLRAFGEELNKL